MAVCSLNIPKYVPGVSHCPLFLIDRFLFIIEYKSGSVWQCFWLRVAVKGHFISHTHIQKQKWWTVITTVVAYSTTQTCFPCRNGVLAAKVTDVFLKDFTVCISGRFDLTPGRLAHCGMHWRRLIKQDKAQRQRMALLFSTDWKGAAHRISFSHPYVCHCSATLSLVSLSRSPFLSPTLL